MNFDWFSISLYAIAFGWVAFTCYMLIPDFNYFMIGLWRVLRLRFLLWPWHFIKFIFRPLVKLYGHLVAVGQAKEAPKPDTSTEYFPWSS